MYRITLPEVRNIPMFNGKGRYGQWITDNGVASDVMEYCGHTKVMPYSDAYDNGYIATVESPDMYCARFELDKVSIPALRTLLKEVKAAEADIFIFESLYMEDCYFGNSIYRSDGSKTLAIRWINQMIKEKKNG